MSPKNKNYIRLMAIKQATMSSALAAAVKIDDARLRKAQTDKLDEILAAIRAEDPTLIDGQAQRVG